MVFTTVPDIITAARSGYISQVEATEAIRVLLRAQKDSLEPTAANKKAS